MKTQILSYYFIAKEGKWRFKNGLRLSHVTENLAYSKDVFNYKFLRYPS
jgi:hypothetical protein